MYNVHQPLFDNCFQLRVVVELVWPLVLFLILMWVKMDNKDLQEHVHECWFCHFAFVHITIYGSCCYLLFLLL